MTSRFGTIAIVMLCVSNAAIWIMLEHRWWLSLSHCFSSDSPALKKPSCLVSNHNVRMSHVWWGCSKWSNCVRRCWYFMQVDVLLYARDAQGEQTELPAKNSVSTITTRYQVTPVGVHPLKGMMSKISSLAGLGNGHPPAWSSEKAPDDKLICSK